MAILMSKIFQTPTTMTLQRRKAVESCSSNSSIESGYSSSEESDDNSKERKKGGEPFYMLVYKVCLVLTGVVIACFLLVVSMSRPSTSKTLNLYKAKMLELNVQPKPDHVIVVMTEEEGLDQLPSIELDPLVAAHDAFGVVQQYLKNHSSPFMHQAQILQDKFADLFGGIRPCRHLLENTLYEFGGDSWARLLQRKRKGVLHMVILGEATAAGYGNLHNQAFSFVLQEILKNVMTTVKVDFQVTNAALEHVSTFPYLWCAQEFAKVGQSNGGLPIDLVYLDLGPSMSAANLELIVRQVLGMQSPAPLLILRDSKDSPDRLDLLQHYIDAGLLQAPVLLEWKDAVDPFFEVKPSRRPPGFTGWTEWGAVESPHKRAYWTAAQHRMVGWVLAMFLLKHLELMVAAEAGLYDLGNEQGNVLHAPILARASDLKDPWSKYIYFPSSSRKCLTSFNPVSNLLPASGAVTQDHHIEHPKGMVFYTSGWVLDMENSERKEKLRSQHHGFRDILASYHGIPASGKLTFNFEVQSTNGLIICESLAPVKADGCRLDRDVEFTLNNRPIKSVRQITTEAISYGGRHPCFHANFESRESGLVQLGMRVTNSNVTLTSGPCTISHIVWQP